MNNFLFIHYGWICVINPNQGKQNKQKQKKKSEKCRVVIPVMEGI